ncbi:MAG: hypothetical protein ACRYFX_09950 [Janthinobacterium lividum]
MSYQQLQGQLAANYALLAACPPSLPAYSRLMAENQRLSGLLKGLERAVGDTRRSPGKYRPHC